jgi:hypothetical protein
MNTGMGTGSGPGAVRPGARPAELVPGRPDDIERLGARLAGFAATAGDAVSRLAAAQADGWAGPAGEVFRVAGGEVPARFGRAAAAFGAASRALRAYGQVLREAQAEAGRAIRLVEQSTPETAEVDRHTADQLVARARGQVEEAAATAAAQLARAAAEAPPAEDGAAPLPAGSALPLQVVTEHQLADPDGFVAPSGDWGDGVADMRYTAPHDVPFATPDPGAVAGAAVDGPAPDGTTVDGTAMNGTAVGGGMGGATPAGEAGWHTWAAAGPGRQLGVIDPATLGALGATAAAAGGALLGRRRTALGLVGLDEAELRRRRDEFGGARHRDGVLTAGRTARLRSADAWRTRLASPPRPEGTVQHWTGSDADRLSRSRATGERSGSVNRDVRGAVLRTGRPAHEGV